MAERFLFIPILVVCVSINAHENEGLRQVPESTGSSENPKCGIRAGVQDVLHVAMGAFVRLATWLRQPLLLGAMGQGRNPG